MSWVVFGDNCNLHVSFWNSFYLDRVVGNCVTMGIYLEQVLPPFGSVLQLQPPVQVSSSLLQPDSQTGFFGLCDCSTNGRKS